MVKKHIRNGNNQNLHKLNIQGNEISRKLKRKQLRIQKKQKKKQFFNKKYPKNNFIQNNTLRFQNKQIKQKISNVKKGQQQKKQFKQFYKQNQSSNKKPLQQKKTNKTNSKQNISIKQKDNQKSLHDQNLFQDQRQIEYYEKKLGLNKKSKGKGKGLAKGLGYDQDLFDFLDNISKKVHNEDQKQYSQNDNDYQINQSDDNAESEQNQNNYDAQQFNQQIQQDDYDNQQQYQYQQNLQNLQNIQEENQQNQFSCQGQQQEDFDHYNNQEGSLNIQDLEQILKQEQRMVQQQIKKSKKQKKNLKDQKKKILERKKSIGNKQQKLNEKVNISAQRPKLFASSNKDQQQKIQIRKKMNGLFNKLSDGNLMITFRQFSEIFLSYSRSNTISVFINIFIKFNVQVQKPHLHILLSNIALGSALHHLIGNRLMAPLIYQIVKRFFQLQQTQQDFQEIQQIGYSKNFQRKKNIVIILAYFYDFTSITGDFISNFVKYLSENINSHCIEFLYLIIQKIGIKIRQNDPAVFKDIIEILKIVIENSKINNKLQTQQKSKIHIIQLQLNQLKFNRKVPQFLDQRLAFLNTLLTKNVPKQVTNQKQILLLTFNQIRKADISKTNWWDYIQKQGLIHSENNQLNNQNIQVIQQLTNQRKQLLQLAKSLNLVTQIRKKIFLQLMQSQDYIQATQRILALKIKNIQQISLVLVQVCIIQPTFNPFYGLVAAKIANINPKFKSKVQFTLWDQLKLLKSFDARKISNLGKFAARFIANPLTNGTLSILKHYNDLINVSSYDSMFLMIFFTQFFRLIKKQQLVQISHKLKQESNSQIKQSIVQYLNQVGIKQNGFNNLQKMKFLRRMILINDQNKMQEEEY